MSVVVSRLLCDRWGGARQRGDPRRKDLDAYFFVFRICRSDFRHRRADSAAERRARSNGMAIGVVMGAQAGARFAGFRSTPARVRRRGQSTGERVRAAFDRAVPLVSRHVRDRASCAADCVQFDAVRTIDDSTLQFPVHLRENDCA